MTPLRERLFHLWSEDDNIGFDVLGLTGEASVVSVRGLFDWLCHQTLGDDGVRTSKELIVVSSVSKDCCDF